MASNRSWLLLGLTIGGLLPALLVGCAADPRIASASEIEASAGADSASPVYATIEEAAIAGLVAAREQATPASRESIRIGSVRRVAAGYVWTTPVAANASLRANRRGSLRIRLTPADVATFVVHPPSGTNAVDRLNATLNASERALLKDGGGRGRPVYLLTPRLAVVRHAPDEPELLVADLRGLRRAAIAGGPEAGPPV